MSGNGGQATETAISLPKGGGAITGLGETFSADLHTGTGNFSVPITVPPGRRGLTPQLALAYSTGTGNGEFGLGWRLSSPGVTRKTARGVPSYGDGDTFVLSGAEDLVEVSGGRPGRVRHRPRTEGDFARIEHVQDATGDYWELRGRDGSVSRYGTVRPLSAPADWRDPAVTRHDSGVFAWLPTETTDSLGNLIRYTYLRDQGSDAEHTWDRPVLHRVEYADYGDRADPSFLVRVEFDHEDRPDPFSDHRAGFEIRTTLRCRAIRISTLAADGVRRVQKEYRLGYRLAPFNGASLLTTVQAVGVDDTAREHMPPVTFAYSGFDPTARRFTPVTGTGLPALHGDPNTVLVDIDGNGLLDLVELGGTHRYWSNRGDGRFDAPRAMREAPSVGDRDVRLLDADGDGRADLLVSGPGGAGYFPLGFDGGWSGRSFRSFPQMPTTDLASPEVRLIDLDGDGLTDVLRSGSAMECWFNDPDPRLAWTRTARTHGPAVDFTDPRVRLADMTGDGLQDIVLLRDGNIAYFPNLGHGRWGRRVHMRQAPRLPQGHDPRRVLLGDVDGDGAADLVYVDHTRVLVWGNRSGNGWTEQPVTVNGTPDVVDTDEIRLIDLHGNGMDGLLWSRAAEERTRFLDFCGGTKPHLLSTMDNQLGARTTVHYSPSTADYLRDRATAATRWRTPLPFPVHVVSSVETEDQISHGRLVTAYRYHHGYWDGVEREFRGFAMVERLDTETIDDAPDHSPPSLTKTWFHPGPVAAVEAGDWTELDLRGEYWTGDPSMLPRPPEITAALAALSRSGRRDALRAMRGRVLRTELYALDGTDRQALPYTVTETLTGIREESPPGPGDDGRPRIFFPFPIATRTTQWERGQDPMTRFAFTTGHDAYGLATGTLSVAVPRGRDPRRADPTATEPYPATATRTEYARRDDDLYLVDRACRTTTFEVGNDGRASVPDLHDTVLAGTADLRVIEHHRTHYDGDAYVGLPLGSLGAFGVLTRTESLVLADDHFTRLGATPPYLEPRTVSWPAEYPAEFRSLTPALAGYRHETGDVPGYYVVGERHRYDFHEAGRTARGMPTAARDPFGAETRFEYDAHDLHPVRVVDPLGLETKASYDPRVLAVETITDVNGNTSSVTYSPAGLVTGQFVRGKNGEGDTLSPSVRLDHDLLAFAERGRPVSVRSTRRVHHDTDTAVPAAERDQVIVSVEFSDGFGRVVQTRTRAEDELIGDPVFGGGVLPTGQNAPVPPTRIRAPGAPENVVVSGWQLRDNKGRVVQRYEPFFSTGFDYAPPGDAQLGRKATISYDPRGHMIQTLNPDGSEQRVVLGVPVDLADPAVFTPTPWETYTYDANDNAGRTHGAAASAYSGHWNTPSSIEVDALGRTVTATARNGGDPIVTRSSYDIQGNLTSVIDPLGREAFAYHHDLAGRVWRADGIDAGRRDTVLDALGGTIEVRDTKGALSLSAFDLAHRPVRVWARNDASGPVTLRQRLRYGDGGTPAQPPATRAAAKANNLLGRMTRHYDEAGLVMIVHVDFKGNVLDSTRQVIADAPVQAVYAAAAANGWTVTPFQVDWVKPDTELLETVSYRTGTEYDALNRIKRQLLPTDVENRRREVRAHYNSAGGLRSVLLDGAVYVDRIFYDARGQRTLIGYGNGVVTRCAYDPDTFRLVRLRSERNGVVLQDLRHEYDLVGNVLAIRDRTPGCGLPVSPDALDRGFTYDPVYRLATANGRETDTVPAAPPWTDLPRGNDITKTRPYTETYAYDAAGCLLRLTHASANGFTRDFTHEAGSNRLRRMTVGATPFDYSFDATGNLVGETATRHFGWNHADQLIAFGTQTAGAEPSVHAQYLYDADGRRVKKLVRRQGGGVTVTHYVGDGFEHHRWKTGANNQIHVMDDRQRIAMVRVGAPHPDDGGPAVAVHLADHLGSSAVVVDGAGAFVSREEYTPYGETSFGSYGRKRYRFTGKERDEESGLSYHQARYYAPWLARWTCCDPIGMAGGLNQYLYAAADPMRLVDPHGQAPVDDEAIPRNGEAIRDVTESARATTVELDTVDQELAARKTEFDAARQKEENFYRKDGPLHDEGVLLQRRKELRGSLDAQTGALKGGIDYLTERALPRINEVPALDTGNLKPELNTILREARAQVAAGERALSNSIRTRRWRELPSGLPTARARQKGSANLSTMGGIAAGGAIAIALTYLIGMAEGDTPDPAEAALAAAASAVPALGILTAKDEGSAGFAVFCIPAWKLCMAGTGVYYGGKALKEGYEYTERRVTTDFYIGVRNIILGGF
ncbi:SpvB/TcaC N-terminal domain-containing protein [Phytomonospora endophytica]|uniref:RHS repeat-associated protein n=1 Tax=Phytomonospora endophytica TaxID=714109 RepID=A0A841G3C7_9ACTN|nr:SpvB/TcaC N-terminal domain-containing protein [Phytomonospora endophytica]MBB6038620.1 RHS repeat-associated protein [Phytomonospora endophytica]GIG69236.1 hypothetical protein Pen01_55310 [Phytomonospora endophytica]